MRATCLLLIALFVQSVAMQAQAPPHEAGCENGAAGQYCRLLANYSLAYTAQQKGDLEQARTYYQRVLTEAPKNGATLNNLALVEDAAGNNSAAEEMWNRAIAADAEHAGQWALQLGDHDLRREQYDAALKAYQLAAEKLPNAETPRRRIVTCYLRLPDNTLDQLAAQAFGWETNFPSTARTAYELLIKRSFNGQSSDEVLRRWVSVVSRHGTWTKSTLSVVPAGWNSQAVHELRGYLENPTAPFNWSWWRQNAARTSSTLELASAMGKEILQETRDASRTAACWEAALNSTGNPDSLMGYRSPDGATTGLTSLLDLDQSLASLYYHYPSLDKDGGKLNRVIISLFQGKAMFIEEGDWEATQNYHTTLAILYADRGIWNPKPGTFFAAGAIYQLKAALQDADRRLRDPKQRFFQPLPELKDRLAEGYAQTNQLDLAAKEYASASAAYMDVDALDAAQKSLAKAQDLKAPAETVTQLSRILETRQKLLQGKPVEISPEKTPWLYQPSGPIDKQFLNRQTFKITADSAISQGTAGSNQDLAVKAYQMATEQQTPLVGGGDLVRWRRLESNLRTKTNTPEAPQPKATVSQAKAPEKAVSVTVPGSWRSTQIAVDPKLSKAVQSMANEVKQ